jgi:hypothetical protein
MVTNGEGRVVELLERILEVQVSTQLELKQFKEGANTRLESLDKRMGDGFGDLRERMDILLNIAGEHHRDLEKRVSVLEAWKDQTRPAR